MIPTAFWYRTGSADGTVCSGSDRRGEGGKAMRREHGIASLTVARSARNGVEWMQALDQRRCADALLDDEWVASAAR